MSTPELKTDADSQLSACPQLHKKDILNVHGCVVKGKAATCAFLSVMLKEQVLYGTVAVNASLKLSNS